MASFHTTFFDADLKEEFRSRLTTQPNQAELHTALGKAYEDLDQGDLQSASRRATQIIPVIAPHDVTLRSAVAYLLIKARRPEAAWGCLATLGELLAADALSALAQAAVLEMSGDPAGALRMLSSASDFTADRAQRHEAFLHLHIARLSALQGDGERMFRSLSIAAETAVLSPADPRLACIRAYEALSRRDHHGFRTFLEVIENSPEVCMDWLDLAMEAVRRFGTYQMLIDVASIARKHGVKSRYSDDEIFGIIRQISDSAHHRLSPEETVRLDARIRVEINSTWHFVDCLVRLALRGTDASVPAAMTLRMVNDALALGLHEHDVIGWAAEDLRSQFSQRVGANVEAQFESWPHSDPDRAAQIIHGWSSFYLLHDDVRAAGVCAGVALMLRPASQSIRYAFAQCLAMVGLVKEAQTHFVQIGCISPEAGATIMWPPGWPTNRSPIVEHARDLIPAGSILPKISVVIPTFNQAWAIEDTILSILNQHYERLQLIVIDGGSTDGTDEILARYANRFDILVSEPDHGQSDAINKGMKHADGDLITWLNSDDMLWPGALHAWAATWLTTGADIIFGLCVTHVNKRINVINMPRVSQEDFNVKTLSNINEFWMQGHYFYQPEVIFTRAIWNKAGSNVDVSNYYCMDYDLWLRMAEQGATLACAEWPTALFRYHDKQKTSNLDLCIHEQGAVRDRFYVDLVPSKRRAEIERKITSLSCKTPLRLAVISTRADKICSASAGQEIADHFSGKGIQAHFYDDPDTMDVRLYDLVILLIHTVPSETSFLKRLKSMHFNGLVVGWYWDNHHLWKANLDTSQMLDVSIPGHAFAGAYLRTTGSALWDAVPLCVTQWTRTDARDMWSENDEIAPRDRSLYGGFVKYPDAVGRNKRLTGIMESGLFPSLYFVDPNTLSTYFTLSARDRFTEWKKYATSFVMPFESDLSQRFFDAWLAGQVPVVAPVVHDLRLHSGLRKLEGVEYVVAASDAPSDIQAAHRRALEIFDEGGPTGVKQRHLRALNGHMLIDRLDEIVTMVRNRAS